MHKHSADKIIESIAEITRHIDRDLLEESMANSLHEQLDIEHVAIYKIYYQYNEPKYLLMLEVVNNKSHAYTLEQATQKNLPLFSQQLSDCLQSKKPAVASISHGKTIYLQPILNHLNEVVSIFTLRSSENNFHENKNAMISYFQVYRNYLRLLNESEHDTLTGLLNRRTFDRDLDKFMSEWKKKDVIANNGDDIIERRTEDHENGNWLAVIDIDFFKRINDKYGHLYGDEVLLLLANIMRESFRNYDKLFRFGGEEFVVILRDTGYTGAETALARFHKKVETHCFPQVGSITISIGYEEIANQTVPSEVLRLADDALYYVKENGRNNVYSYKQLLAEGKVTAPHNITHSDIELF